MTPKAPDTTLVYLPPTVLADRLFTRDFFVNYKRLKGKSLLLHGAPDDDPDRLWFLTKRISANLSENMTVNVALSGASRGLIEKLTDANGAHYYMLKTEFLYSLFRTCDCVVVNLLVLAGENPENAAPDNVLPDIQDRLRPSRTLIFPLNPGTPLGAHEPARLSTAEDSERLRLAFPEERAAVELAYRLRPAYIVSAKNFGNVQ